MRYREEFSLKERTTFHLPIVCKYFVEYSTLDELKEIMADSRYKSMRSFQMGGGSNLLFTQDYDGIVLHSRIDYIKILHQDDATVLIEAGAGVVWDDFVKYCVANKYYGAENLSYIPGEVGASAIQNIGSYGAEVRTIIHHVNCIDKFTGEVCVFDNEQCQYGYRDSIFKNEYKDRYIVVSVVYQLSKVAKFNLEYGPLKKMIEQHEAITLETVRDTIIKVRTSKLPDPKYIGSVGSFFKNPIITMSHFKSLQSKYPDIAHYAVDENSMKVPAGWLIEHAGLKGYSLGDASIYEKQCLVIVNNGNATSSDIISLYKHIIDTVYSLYGIELHPEANII